MIESQKYDSQAPIDVLSLNSKTKQTCIQTPNEHINRFFGGGLHYGMITQLYG